MFLPIFCNESEKRTKTCKELIEENNPDEAGKLKSYIITDNGQIKAGNKTYSSLDDLAAGNYIPKRIYTIDEANAVAGLKNRISIKYK